MIEILKGTLEQLKEFISGYTFSSEDEEIQFFKEQKPLFTSSLLFYTKVYNTEMNCPVGSVEEQVDYLKEKLRTINNFNSNRLDFYRYYRSGATHLDREYFLRGNGDTIPQYLDSFYFERDPQFSTRGDHYIAKMMANEMVYNYLIEQIESVSTRRVDVSSLRYSPIDSHLWTDKKAGLIEIIYSIDALCSVDNGDIALKEIQTIFERCFGVDLGNISRAFSEMRIRNTPTPYLDRMKEALIRRMNALEDGAIGSVRK